VRRIGIDVGGTNTDAVLVEEGSVAAAVKAPTTPDVTSGILDALARLTATGRVAAGPLDAVMIGTTHFINAVVQRRDLSRVGALRIGLPASASLPPFCDWPGDLADLVCGHVAMVEGGHEYDGRPFMPLDTAAIRREAQAMRAAGLRSVAVSSVFSPLDPSHEREAAAILREEMGDVAVTLSSDLGRIGLLERENAALLNAALADLARETIAAFARALARSGLSAPLYITQNDGTVVGAAEAMRLPVYSFASGATNSMRGAAYLSGIADALVADVGGTTTDIGELRLGFPREANNVVAIGGVRTLFRMPDLLSFGLGGGSHVSDDGSAVGPVSVGYRLSTDALAFGGHQLTATDVGVAAGLVDIGDRAKVGHLDRAICERALARIRSMLEDHVDRVKTNAGDVILLAVGGGAFLVPKGLEGVSSVLRLPHGDCANAVGAAIAQVSGEIDQVFRDMSREEALAEAARLAAAGAVASGADPARLTVVDSEDIPIAYLPGNARRIRVRCVGDIGLSRRDLSAGPDPRSAS
jgi:N-methylhydantoinase A/oxoprolinase/acetone carboxylase beta subunit